MRAVVIMAYLWFLTASSVGPVGTASGSEPDGAYPPLGLEETSGMATSWLHDGVLWVVEDGGLDQSAAPAVLAFDQSGAQVGSVLLSGWNNRDIEALAIGPGPMLWVADIGDNAPAERESVVVHTFAEPVELGDRTLEPVSYRLRYPDGPRDAEAIMVDPVDGRLYLATKSAIGSGSLYVAPAELAAGETHDLVRLTSVPSWITDGTFSPIGDRLLLLRAVPTLGGAALVLDVLRPDAGAPVELAEAGSIDLPTQPQAESLTVTRDGQTVLVGSEGADQPVLAVALPPPAAPTGPAGLDATIGPGPPPPETGAADGCRLADPRSCLDEPAGWLAASGVALAALIVGALAVLRRRQP